MIDANLGVATDGCRTRLHYFEGFGGRSPGLTVVPHPYGPDARTRTNRSMIWSAEGRAGIGREPDEAQDGSWQRHHPTLQRIWDWLAEITPKHRTRLRGQAPRPTTWEKCVRRLPSQRTGSARPQKPRRRDLPSNEVSRRDNLGLVAASRDRPIRVVASDHVDRPRPRQMLSGTCRGPAGSHPEMILLTHGRDFDPSLRFPAP